MFTSPSLFGISLVERQQTAEIGDFGFFTTRFRIFKTQEPVSKKVNSARVAYRNLLPAKSSARAASPYVGIREAAKLTGIIESEVRDLCERGIVTSRKIGKKRVRVEVERESLLRYVNRQA